MAKHIKGGFSGIATELKGLKPSDINSLSFVEKMKRRFPSVFAEGSGINAYKFAKEHWQEKAFGYHDARALVGFETAAVV